MVPEGWTKERIGDRVDIKHGFAFSSKYFNMSGDGHRLLTPGHFFENGGFRYVGDKQRFFSGPVPIGYLLPKGEVLIAMTEQAPGLLGSSAIVPEEGKYLHNQRLGLIAIRNSQNTDPVFVFHLFNASYVRHAISTAAGGTKVRHTSPDKIKQVLALFPPKPEQLVIARILSAWDSVCSELNSLIAAKHRMKQALMQELLTGTRRFQNETSDSWETVLLRDVVEECEERNHGRQRIDAVMAVTKADGMVPMKERTISANTDRYLIVQKDWFAYNPMRINIGSLARWTEDREVVVSPDYVVFRCKAAERGKPAIDPDFLDHYRRSGLWERFVTPAGSGGVRIRIYFSDLGHMKLHLPPLKEQREIADLLNTANREIDILKKQLAALKEQKKGLMQKLLTGDLRLTVS